MSANLERLRGEGLDEHQAFNAQGNSFDRTALAIRIREAVALWVREGVVARHAYPSPGEVLASYERLRASPLLAGLPAVRAPFPDDLMGALLHGAGGAGGELAHANQAAEDGRREG